MAFYIAILRGINISGKNKIKMADLRESLENLGFTNVKTYIQSGNIIFEALKAPVKKLSEMIQKKIVSNFGFSVLVIVKTPLEINETITNNPFLKQKNYDPSKFHVTFLSKLPRKIDLEKLSEVKSEDQVYCYGKDIYLYCPNGYGRTKLTNNFLEKLLAVSATTRNWKTVNNLYALTQS